MIALKTSSMPKSIKRKKKKKRFQDHHGNNYMKSGGMCVQIIQIVFVCFLMKATRDRDAWKVMIAYAKEHGTRLIDCLID